MKVWRIFPPAVCMILSVILISCGSPTAKDAKDKDKASAADKDEGPGTDAGKDKDAAPKDADNKDAAPKDGDKKDAAPKDGDKKDAGKDTGAAKKGKAKYTIKQVMAAHKEGLHTTVASGKADFKEKILLVEYYTALSENTPPKGSKESWKKLTDALIIAASGVRDKGDKDSQDKLVAAFNCMACHSVHRIKKK